MQSFAPKPKLCYLATVLASLIRQEDHEYLQDVSTHLHRVYIEADQVPLVLAQAGLRCHVLQVLLQLFPHDKISTEINRTLGSFK